MSVAPIVAVARQWPPATWQDVQRHSQRRQALLRYLACCELTSIDQGPVAEQALWALVYRDLTALRVASGRDRSFP